MNSSLYRQTFEEEKRTIGGLLLLFCVTRTVISPIYTVIQYYLLFESLGGATKVLSQFPLLWVLLGADTLLSALGIWAGCLVWQMRVRGILLAKIYLIASVALPLAMAIVFQFLRMGALAQALAGGVIPAAFFAVLWFVYLSLSERVRNIREIERERVSNS